MMLLLMRWAFALCKKDTRHGKSTTACASDKTAAGDTAQSEPRTGDTAAATAGAGNPSIATNRAGDPAVAPEYHAGYSDGTGNHP
jgi:hypothetical protein